MSGIILSSSFALGLAASALLVPPAFATDALSTSMEQAAVGMSAAVQSQAGAARELLHDLVASDQAASGATTARELPGHLMAVGVASDRPASGATVSRELSGDQSVVAVASGQASADTAAREMPVLVVPADQPAFGAAGARELQLRSRR